MSQILIGLGGTELTAREREYLARADVGGVVQFSRNFVDVDQFLTLNESIRSIDPQAIIAIDQEGGRVQRVHQPATTLPALARIGELWDDDPDEALELAFRHGWLMASEMIALGVDISFAPVLDLDRGSSVIGNRAIHADCEPVKELGRAYIKGMREAGMAATGKHFPGHGWVAEDTHEAVAVDGRSMDQIAIDDLRPYSVAMRNGLEAVMMAHVIYPQVCPHPAGYSPVWCRQVLRERMRFEGIIFSDDLGMRAAAEAGGFRQRMEASVHAGCDLVLICRPEDVSLAMAEIPENPNPGADRRDVLRARRSLDWQEFATSGEREMAQIALETLEE